MRCITCGGVGEDRFEEEVESNELLIVKNIELQQEVVQLKDHIKKVQELIGVVLKTSMVYSMERDDSDPVQ